MGVRAVETITASLMKSTSSCREGAAIPPRRAGGCCGSADLPPPAPPAVAASCDDRTIGAVVELVEITAGRGIEERDRLETRRLHTLGLESIAVDGDPSTRERPKAAPTPPMPGPAGRRRPRQYPTT